MENKQTIKGFLEFDMQVVPDGNEHISNSHQQRVRHAFLQYGNWLMGQTWSTFQDVKGLPETIYFIGVIDGTVFSRQAMIRYIHANFQVALENPETTVTSYGGGSRIVKDDGAVPNVVFRYQQSADWGHFAAVFLARQFSYQNKTGDLNIDTTETSYGLSLTGKVKFGQDDLRVMFTAESGLGRYLGLNVANGTVLDANNQLNAIDSTGFTIAYCHLWDSQWRSNFMYS